MDSTAISKFKFIPSLSLALEAASSKLTTYRSERSMTRVSDGVVKGRAGSPLDFNVEAAGIEPASENL